MKFKNKEEIDNAIEQFSTCMSNDYTSVRKSFFDCFGDMPIAVMYLKSDTLHNHLCVFRSRIASEIKDKKNPKEFSYPSDEDNTKIGRANWANRSVLYASDSPYTSLSETKEAKTGNEFYISQWGLYLGNFKSDKIPFRTFAIDNIDDKNPWNEILKTKNDFFELFCKTTTVEEAELKSYLIAKLSSLFTNLGEKQYALSAFMADYSMYSPYNMRTDQLCPIIIYPSVTNNHRSCNFAIHPLFVDKWMRLDKVIKIKIEEKNSDGIKYSYSEIGIIDENGQVSWYSTDYDITKSIYRFVSVKCGCGKQVFNVNFNELTFKKNGKNLSCDDIVKILLCKIDYKTKFLVDDHFLDKGLVSSIHINVKEKIENITLDLDNENHSDLFFEIEFIQPLTYRLID